MTANNDIIILVLTDKNGEKRRYEGDRETWEMLADVKTKANTTGDYQLFHFAFNAAVALGRIRRLAQ